MTRETNEREARPAANGRNGHNMLDLAAQVEAHYTSPSPLATIRPPAIFPRALDLGLWGGLIGGGLLGLLFGWLLQRGLIAPAGFEGLFALVPFTFYSLWAFVGAAAGLAIGGVIALLATPVPVWQEMARPEERAVVTEEPLVLVEVEERAA